MTRTWPALEVTFGSQGVVDELQAALHDYAVTAIGEDGDVWHVVFRSSDERDRAHADLSSAFPQLRLRPFDVPDEDWAARSQASIGPVQVGRVVVAPPWNAPTESDPDRIVVVIQPSMGFGTGHHATTRLCLAALQRLPLRDRSVTDVGTGSGVLAIAASLLGASPVVAVDLDPDAIQAASENLPLNMDARVDLRLSDLRSLTLLPADLVLANLTGGLLMQEAARLRRLTDRGGDLVLSGLLASEEDGVLSAFPGSTLAERTREDDWVCLRLAFPV